jgi:hypothetical protein
MMGSPMESLRTSDVDGILMISGWVSLEPRLFNHCFSQGTEATTKGQRHKQFNKQPKSQQTARRSATMSHNDHKQPPVNDEPPIQ